MLFRSGLQFAGAEESGAALAVWRQIATQPSQAAWGGEASVGLSLKDLPSADQLAGQLRDCGERVLAERLRRRICLRRSIGDGPSFRLPYFVWRLGDAVLVGVPAEAHSPLQVELRRRFPRQAIVVMNIVNGYYSYLPPADDYTTGSYQVEVSLFRAGCLERLIEACAQAVQRITDATAAVPLQADSVGLAVGPPP